MNIHTKISLIGGMFLAMCTTLVFAQMPGMPYMPYVKPIIPATITLSQNQKYMVASIYDTDYLPYTTPTAAAATGAVTADGNAESTTVNVQGSISSITVYIPVTATGDGTLQAYTSSPITIPAALTQDLKSRDLTLSWAAQAYTSSTISITATLAVVGGATLNAKKLDINGGVGNDHLGVLLGSLSYPYNHAGTTTTYQIRDIAGIPDKMFGKYDTGNHSTYEHNFIYVPVVGEDGNIWLNNNLGADYNNISSSVFSLYGPAQQASYCDDYHAYGSLFQWGRCADGHELISWSGNNGTAKYSAISGQSASDTPTNANFLYGTDDWRNPQNDNLWQG